MSNNNGRENQNQDCVVPHYNENGMKTIQFEEVFMNYLQYGFNILFKEEPKDYVLKVGESWIDDDSEEIDSYLSARWIIKEDMDKKVGREISREEWESLVDSVDLHVKGLCDGLKSNQMNEGK